MQSPNQKMNKMKITTTLLAFLLSLSAFAQRSGEVVIFSENGEKFYALLNSVYQNYDPEANVRISDLTQEWYKCKIVSANNIFVIERNLPVKMNTTTTYRIVEKNGTYKLRYFSESPMNNYTQPSSGQTAIVYHSTGHEPNFSQTTTTTTTTTTSSGGTNPSGGESLNININMNENGMSTNISGHDGMQHSQTTTYSETTTTTTTSHSGTTQTNVQNNNSMSGFNNGSCYLDNAGFQRLKSSIESESFEDDKLRLANGAARNKCMSVQQVIEIAELFSFSDDKLSFTKAAYGNCTNRQDYYEVLGVFTFSDDKEELESYMDSH